MTDFIEKPIKVEDLIIDNMLSKYRIVWIKLALKDKSKGVILNL